MVALAGQVADARQGHLRVPLLGGRQSDTDGVENEVLGPLPHHLGDVIVIYRCRESRKPLGNGASIIGMGGHGGHLPGGGGVWRQALIGRSPSVPR